MSGNPGGRELSARTWCPPSPSPSGPFRDDLVSFLFPAGIWNAAAPAGFLGEGATRLADRGHSGSLRGRTGVRSVPAAGRAAVALHRGRTCMKVSAVRPGLGLDANHEQHQAAGE